MNGNMQLVLLLLLEHTKYDFTLVAQSQTHERTQTRAYLRVYNATRNNTHGLL